MCYYYFFHFYFLNSNFLFFSPGTPSVSRPFLTLQVCPGFLAGTMSSSAPAPDGGWGWMIVMACFTAQLLAYGSPQSVGILYPEWLHTFQQSKGMTAWVGSLVSGVGLIASE